MQLNIFASNDKSQPTFGYGIPKKVFKDIREIPHLSCARCGRDMISLPERDAFVNKLLAGSKASLDNSAMDEYRFSPAFKFLYKLAKQHPRTPLVTIVEDKNVKYRMRGLGNFGRKDVYDIVDISKTVMQKSPQVMKKLNIIKPELSEEYRELLDVMEVYSIKYPKNTFSEIFRKPEVVDYHNRIRQFKSEQFRVLREDSFKKLDKLSKTMTEEEKKQFATLNTEAKNIISSAFYSKFTKDTMLEILYKDFLTNLSDKKLAGKIQKHIDNLPYNITSADNKIIGMGTLNDREFVTSIVDDISSTYEHIVPASQKGSSAQHNGLCFCRHCNAERATIPYTVLMEKFPEFAGNVQKQMNKVMVFLKHGLLPNYRTYPQKVKKTLLEVTEQQLRINIKKYLKFREQEAKARVVETKARIGEGYKIIDESRAKIGETRNRIAELYKEIDRLNMQAEALKAKAQKTSSKIKTYKEDYKNAKFEYHNIAKTLKEDK